MATTAIVHDYLLARTDIELTDAENRFRPVFAYIADLERRLEEGDPDLPRLARIEEAAERAVWYHERGRNPDSDFDANRMIELMDELEAAL